MPTSRRAVDSIARRAGRRPISRRTSADLADALREAEHALTSVEPFPVADLCGILAQTFPGIAADLAVTAGPPHTLETR